MKLPYVLAIFSLLVTARIGNPHAAGQEPKSLPNLIPHQMGGIDYHKGSYKSGDPTSLPASVSQKEYDKLKSVNEKLKSSLDECENNLIRALDKILNAEESGIVTKTIQSGNRGEPFTTEGRIRIRTAALLQKIDELKSAPKIQIEKLPVDR